jgi:hypothetical protein
MVAVMTKMMATVFAKMSHTQDSSSRRVASRLLLTLAFAVIGVASPMAHADHKGADLKRSLKKFDLRRRSVRQIKNAAQKVLIL